MSRKTAREVAMKLAFASLFGGEETYEDVLDKSGITEKPMEEDKMCIRDRYMAVITAFSVRLWRERPPCF